MMANNDTIMRRATILIISSLVGVLFSLVAAAEPASVIEPEMGDDDDFVIIDGVIVDVRGDEEVHAVGVVVGDEGVINIGAITVTASSQARPSSGAEATAADANAIGIARGEGHHGAGDHHGDFDFENGDELIHLEETPEKADTAEESGFAHAHRRGHHPGHGHGNHHDSGSEIINEGTITVTASSQAKASSASTPTTADAEAIGIAGDSGDDVITNTGTINVTATAKAEGVGVTLNVVDQEADVSREALASANGILGDRGNDKITNTGAITVTADATVNTTKFGVTLIGGAADLSSSSVASSRAIGIDGGDGNDYIYNQGPTVVTADAVADSDQVSIDLISALQGESVRAPLNADAMAVGIVGGKGNDKISNTGTLQVTANATADALEIGLSAVDLSTAGTSTTSNAAAIGIDGGTGNDEITNTGTMMVTSNAGSSSTKVDVTLLNLAFLSDLVGPPVDSSIASTAHTTGITGGYGSDKITNIGNLTATASAETATFDFSMFANKISNPLGAELPQFFEQPIFDADTKAEAHSIGIDSGSGDDTITNSGTLTSNANADVSALSVFVSVPVKELQIPEEFRFFSAFTSNLATESLSSANGISSGEGHDSVFNDGTISADALAKSRSNKVLATIKPDLGGGNGDGEDDEGSSLSLGAGLVDVGARAEATASGVKTDKGNDLVINNNDITAKATADAIANNVTVDLEQASSTVSVNALLARASTEGIADATGISTGSGNDAVFNQGDVLVESLADTNSNTVVVDAQILKDTTLALGAKLLDANTEANARSEGVDTGTGHDVVRNSGSITARANADALGVDVDIRAQTATEDFAIIGQGAWISIDTIANADARGIVGGDGKDRIWNSGTVDADANADASSIGVAAVGAGTKKGASIGVALTQAKSEGNANSSGISGGADKDKIINSGVVKSKSAADVDAVDVSVSLTLTDKGVALTGTAADGSTTVLSTAKGITGGDGADYIRNEGTVDVFSDADAESVSVSVSASGTATGVGLGLALSRATSEAEAESTGISGGADSDMIFSSGLVKSHANADVVAGSGALAAGGTGKGLTVQGAAADGSTKALSTAAGITGDQGMDYIRNEGTVDVLADAKATSVSVSASAQGAGAGVGLGIALSRATSQAEANSTGIGGGVDSDMIYSSGLVKSHAKADVVSGSGALAIGFVGKGVDLKGAAADGSTKGTSNAIGISGDHGKDYIYNDNTVDVLADAKAKSISVADSNRRFFAIGSKLRLSNTPSGTPNPDRSRPSFFGKPVDVGWVRVSGAYLKWLVFLTTLQLDLQSSPKWQRSWDTNPSLNLPDGRRRPVFLLEIPLTRIQHGLKGHRSINGTQIPPVRMMQLTELRG